MKTQSDSSTETKLEHPKMYMVVMLNDDFTPMDFVVLVLEKFFQKSAEEAKTIMMRIHQEGRGVAGIFSLQVAEMKTMQVNQFARLNKYPLKCIMEPEKEVRT